MILLLFFWVTALRVKELFDCSSLSQWQIPSRLLDRASSFSFSHSLILPKMLFNTLSLPFSCFDYCFDDGSRGISNPAPSSTGSIAGKFATFSLNFALNPLLCSAVQPSSTRQFCILSIQSIPFKVGDVDAAPLPPIPVLEARTSAYVINCSVFGFQLCFPCFPDCYCRFPFIHCLIIGFCSVKSH